MPDIIWKTHDTFPPWVTALSQNGQLIDLSTATAVKILLKGTGAVVTSTCVKLTVVTPTCTTSTGSNILTVVSSFTNVQMGGTITGAGIPVGARVNTFDSVAGTITMTDATGAALNATASASGVTITLNKGCAQYTPISADLATVDTWNVEHEITWTGGGVQTVPNAGYNSAATVADLEGA